MFIKRSDKKSGLDEAIDTALAELKGYDSTDAGYSKQIEQIERLYKIRSAERSGRVSPDTLAVVVGNFVGIIAILNHERVNVVTSKALSFVLKPH